MSEYMRREVKEFAYSMEYKLQINDQKGTWKDCDFDYLLKRLREETDEIETALKEGKNHIEIANECADVGNFAMMIADIAREKWLDKVAKNWSDA